MEFTNPPITISADKTMIKLGVEGLGVPLSLPKVVRTVPLAGQDLSVILFQLFFRLSAFSLSFSLT